MKYLFLFLLLTHTLCAYPQEFKPEEYRTTLIRINKGTQVSYKSVSHSFSFNVLGHKIEPQKPAYLLADGNILQYQIVPFPQKIDFKNLTSEAKQGNLLAYMDYEMSYIKEQLGVPNLEESNDFLTLNGQLFLSWSYKMPDSYKTVHKQCYLVTVCFDHMLILNSPVDNDKTEASVKAFLVEIGKTLQTN